MRIDFISLENIVFLSSLIITLIVSVSIIYLRHCINCSFLIGVNYALSESSLDKDRDKILSKSIEITNGTVVNKREINVRKQLNSLSRFTSIMTMSKAFKSLSKDKKTGV